MRVTTVPALSGFLPMPREPFVFWWDTQAEKSEGGRPTKNRIPSDTGLVAGANGLPDRLTISRWRKRLGTPEAFERTCQDAGAGDLALTV